MWTLPFARNSPKIISLWSSLSRASSKQPAMAALANWNAKKSMLGACRRAAVAAARQQPALKSSSRGLVAAQKKPPLVAVLSPMDSPALKALPGDVNAELLIGSDVPSLLSYGDRLRDAEGDHIGYRIRASISFCSVHQRHVVRLTSICLSLCVMADM